MRIELVSLQGDVILNYLFFSAFNQRDVSEKTHGYLLDSSGVGASPLFYG
jgi:hypothetical protein